MRRKRGRLDGAGNLHPRTDERTERLERQRGGARVFATLDAVARCLAGLGLPAFRVKAAGLDGEEPP